MNETRTPVADLHCDLLAYLIIGDDRSALDPASRASLPDLEAGGVRTQALAIFSPCQRQSVDWGTRQVAAYQQLLEDHADRVRAIRCAGDLAADDRIGLVPAFESACTFADEDEPLRDALERFDDLRAALGSVLYVSLTWADDNRFGGGNRSRRGLTDDGRRLLDHMIAARTRGGGPALDFSHASPWLAEDMLEHLTRVEGDLPRLASHSCFRCFVDTPRNLDDDVARTIFEHGGVVGLNLMKPWNGGTAPDRFRDQAQHALALGGADAFGFGADYFCTEDVPAGLRSPGAGEEFFPGFGNASCYPRVLEAFAGIESAIPGVAHQNVEAFVARVLGS